MVVRVEYEKGKISSTPCEWKDALPHRNESKILCLNVGNTSYRWAMHRGLQENFTPCVFWRYVKSENIPNQSLLVYVMSMSAHP